MPHTIRDKTALLARTRRIRGQTHALEKALSENAECDAVLQQIAAIRGAINGLMAEVMEGHLRDHVAAPASGVERQKELGSVVRLLRSYLK